jgi:uncharacterized protein (TIGR02687 family)
MNLQRISESLSACYASHRVVFWHDADAEFVSQLDALELPGVQVLKLDHESAIKIKRQIEADLHQSWLLYSNQEAPTPDADWLLDVRLRSKSFRADTASMLLEDLGLTTLTLLPHLKLRTKFLRAKDRVERLKRLTLPGDDAEALDRKMMAVLLRTDESDALALAMRLLHAMWVPGEAGLQEEPKAWQEVVSQELDTAFWILMRMNLGYEAEVPSLKDLLIRILVTDFVRGLNVPCPAALAHLVLPNKVLAANASVMAGRWRGDLNLHKSYADVSAAVASTLNLADLLAALQPEDLADTVTFAVVEQRILGVLKQRIIGQGGAVLSGLRPLIARRRDGPWVSQVMSGASEQSKALSACYDALEAAAEFMALKEQNAGGLSFVDAADAVDRYRRQLYGFDQLYRRFHRAAGLVEPTGWAVLHELKVAIEDAYSGWFMPQLSSAWGKVVEGGDGQLNLSALAGLPKQQNFFADKVSGALKSGVKRVFVLISDAFRYEAGEELVHLINGTNRLKAQLDAMVGVLPSYTSLGMAALLPHETLSYKPDGSVLVDGLPTSTLEARSAVLDRHAGMAVKADDLLALGKEKGRELVKAHQVVYVYHDRIDLLGDKQASEGQTFDAVADTLTELQAVVSHIINNLNGSMVLLTADHGFIYQESALDGADKAALGEKPDGTVKAKKRYLIGRDLPANSKAWQGNTSVTAGTVPSDGSMDFWVPKGTMRFHFAGGARFVHGSAMPQELIVPLITIRSSEAATAKTRMVGISLLGSSNKVVTNTQRFEFIQSEAVSTRVQARSVLVSLRDGQDLISDEQALTLDSTSTSMNDWVRQVFLTVRSGNYDRTRDYFLVVREATPPYVEVLRAPVRIDLAFTNDF